MMSAPMGGGAMSAPTAGASRGGLGNAVGGVTNTVGNTAGTVGNTAGNVAGSAGSTVNSTAGAVGSTTSATGALTGESSGVIGLKNLQLNSEAANATNGSVITSPGKNVKLDSGSRMVLDVVGSSQ
jgi:phage-related tail protein